MAPGAEESTAMRKRLIPTGAILLGLAGCADLTATQQRTMTGGLGGAAGGAVIGALAGNAGMGALIGAGAGAAGGYLFDQHKQSEQRAYERGVQTGRSQGAR
jgi:osmotically inducible lipoprotein OsmB